MTDETLDKIVNVAGALPDALLQLDPSTIWTIRQLMNSRDDRLMHGNFWVNNSALFDVEGGEAVLYFGRGNLTFDHILKGILKEMQEMEAVAKTVAKIALYSYGGSCKPNSDQVREFKEAETSSRFKISDLELELPRLPEADEGLVGQFDINTNTYESLNHEQRRFAETIYGLGPAFTEKMRILRERGIEAMGVSTLSPKHVTELAQEGPIARVCRTHRFGSYQRFYTHVKNISDLDCYMRGTALKL